MISKSSHRLLKGQNLEIIWLLPSPVFFRPPHVKLYKTGKSRDGKTLSRMLQAVLEGSANRLFINRYNGSGCID